MPVPMNVNVNRSLAEPSQVDKNTPSLQKDEWLTNFAVGYRDNQLVLSRLLPEKRVKKDTAKYRVYSPKSAFKTAPKRAETALPGQAALQYSEDSYVAEEYALEGWVSDAAIQNAADDLEPMADEAEFLASKIMLTEEVLIATEIITAIKAAGSSYYSLLTNTTKWNGGTSADILADLSTGIKAVTANIGRRPNLLTLDTNTYEVIIHDENIVEVLKRHSTALVTEARPVNQLRGMPILLADAVVNIASQESPTYSNVLYDLDTATAFKQCVFMTYVEGANKLTLGRNFVPQVFEAFRGRSLEGDRRKATLAYVSKKLAPKVTNAGAGYIIANVLG